jgi:hypothetical protein
MGPEHLTRLRPPFAPHASTWRSGRSSDPMHSPTRPARWSPFRPFCTRAARRPRMDLVPRIVGAALRYLGLGDEPGDVGDSPPKRGQVSQRVDDSCPPTGSAPLRAREPHQVEVAMLPAVRRRRDVVGGVGGDGMAVSRPSGCRVSRQPDSGGPGWPGRGAAVQPVPPMVGLTPGQGPSTAGDHTAAVAHGQREALGGLDDPGGAAHIQRLAGRPTQDRGQQGGGGPEPGREG